MTKPILSSLLCALSFLLPLGCADDDPLGSGDAGDETGDDTSDDDTGDDEDYLELSDPLFSYEQLMQVEIEMDPASWHELRYDAPGLEHFAQDSCPSGPRPRSFDWHGAEVSVEGVSYGEVELRKKGFKGSMYPDKPSLKIKFDREDKPGGVRRMTLNNAVQDPTFARECLSYHLFAKAGLAAPRCGLAQVWVNGENAGVYLHIEEIRKPMLGLNFGDGEGELWESSLADFTPEIAVQLEAKRDAEIYDAEFLPGAIEALTAPDDQLLASLDPYFDLDQYFTHWSLEVLSAHWDGYAGNRNNTYIYRDPASGKLNFIPWGTDGTFVEPEDFFGAFIDGQDTMPWSVYAHGQLARRLYALPEGRQRYEDALRSGLESVWDEGELLEILDTIEASVTPHLNEVAAAASAQASQELRDFIAAHQQRLLDELDEGLPEWDRPISPPLCVTMDQRFTGSLAMEFGAQGDPFASGEGQGIETVAGQDNPLGLVGGVISEHIDDLGNPMVELMMGLGPATNGYGVIVQVFFPRELLEAGGVVKLDYGQADSSVAWVDLDSEELIPAGFVATGQLTIVSVDEEPGGMVEIGFDAPVAVIELGQD